MTPNAFTARREALRDALGHPRAQAFLAEELERERQKAVFKPGRTLDEVAWHAGRVAVLDEIIRQLEQLKKE